MSTVLIRHAIKYDKTGASRFVSGRQIVQRIVAMYSDGRVRTTSGDVWRVRRHDGGAAVYETLIEDLR